MTHQFRARFRALIVRDLSSELMKLSGWLVLSVVSLVFLSALSMELLSAVRAYVNGEGLWSKSQKDAVLFLTRYANTRSEIDYDRFRSAMRVPLGDHAARIELNKASFDVRIARQGFLDGRNHPQDVDRLVWLYRRFHEFSYMRKAIDIWRQADLYIERLDRLGERLHGESAAAAASREEALAEIEGINDQLTPLEDNFSKTLGEAARFIQRLLLWLLCVGGAILIVGGCATCLCLLSQIRESEQRYKTLIATASDAIVIADVSSGQIIETNKRADDLFGWEPDVLAGTIRELEPQDPESIGFWKEFVASIARGGGGCREMQLLRADGDSVPIEVSANLTQVGRQPVLQAIIRDITSRKMQEEELRAARDHALHSSRVKGQFLANMSHEIRTPMSGVFGMLTVLLETELTAEQKGYAEVAKESAESLLEIINDILDFSRMEAGRLEIRVDNFDLREMGAKVVGMLRPKAEQKGVALSYWCDPALPNLLNGDALRLRQILTNLVGNAVKFTEQGNVTLRILSQSAEGGPERVRFEVQDTGIGIPVERQAALFEAFSQSDSALTRKFGGSGLGLAISKQLVNLMGGQIGVSSKPDKGSTFWFAVNLAPSVRVDRG